jgi:hypothetical protein
LLNWSAIDHVVIAVYQFPSIRYFYLAILIICASQRIPLLLVQGHPKFVGIRKRDETARTWAGSQISDGS